MNWKNTAGVVLLIVVGLALIWWLSANPSDTKKLNQITKTVEGTDIPPTARALDNFAFVDESGVYLRGNTGTSSLKIPDADPETFKRVGDFIEWGNEEILDRCKGPGQYGIYSDREKVYLFQLWETPTFAKTKIQVLQPLDPATFAITGPQSFRDATHQNLTLGYTFGTTTCQFVMQGL